MATSNKINTEDNDYFIYDIVSKNILDYSEDVVRRTLEYMFKKPIIGEIKNMPTETFGKRVDILVRVGSDSLFHIESESSSNRKKDLAMSDRMVEYFDFFHQKYRKIKYSENGFRKNTLSISQMVMYINNHPNLSHYTWCPYPDYQLDIKIIIFNVIDLKFKEMEEKELYPLMILIIANLRSQYKATTKTEMMTSIAETIAKYYHRINKLLFDISLDNQKDALVLNKSLLMLKRSFYRLNPILINILNREGLAVSREEELFMLDIQEQIKEEERQEIKEKSRIEGQELEKQRVIKALNQENLTIELIAKIAACPIEYVKQVLAS
ncbi:MAG: hypothetical protein ATN31_09740 [Candidatus Epulonipiscioides saccharophilum]|nr:MAG: hypothetical protein ATN31_09740 [Epulopiscium sp. AS2M-Bin001]